MLVHERCLSVYRQMNFSEAGGGIYLSSFFVFECVAQALFMLYLLFWRDLVCNEIRDGNNHER